MKQSTILWILRKNKKHIPMLILVTVLFAVVAYLGVQATLQTKALLEIVQRNMQGVTKETAFQKLFTGEFLQATIVLAIIVGVVFLLRFIASDL